jgi:hypothetical protein
MDKPKDKNTRESKDVNLLPPKSSDLKQWFYDNIVGKLLTGAAATLLLYLLKQACDPGVANGFIYGGIALTSIFLATCWLLYLNKIAADRHVNRISDMIRNWYRRRTLEAECVANISGDFMDDKGYERTLELIRGATESIMVIGDFSPKHYRLKTTEDRDDYLREIECILERRASKGGRFRYIRVIQREHADYVNMTKECAGLRLEEKPFTLSQRHLEGDEQMFDHIERILQLESRFGIRWNARVSATIKVISAIPSIPSLLVIDNRYICITLPMPLGGKSHSVMNHGVLILEDDSQSGEVAKFFREMVLMAAHKCNGVECVVARRIRMHRIKWSS